MSNRRFWILSAILLIAIMLIEFQHFRKTNPYEKNYYLIYLIEIVANLLASTFYALIATAVISLVPYKDWNYKSKFRYLYPIVITVVISLFYGSLMYTGYFHRKILTKWSRRIKGNVHNDTCQLSNINEIIVLSLF